MVACLAGACVKGERSLQLIVAGSADKTAAADTAKIEMTMELVADETESLVINGAIDFAHDLASMKISVEDESIDSVLAGDVLYQRFPGLDLPEGKAWLRLSAAELEKFAGGDLGALNAGGQDDPTSTLSQLRGAGNVRKVGTDTVRGTATTRYRATVDLADAAAKADNAAEAKALRTLAKELKLKTLPFDVWLDDQERVWRLKQTIDFSRAELSGDEADLQSMTMTMELFDFGSPVDIAVPAEAEVVDFKEVFGNIPGNGQGSGKVTAATTALEPKVLTDVLAGYTREADDVGDTGPSDLEKAIRDDGEDGAREALVNFVAGYQRLWTKGDNEIVVFLYQFTSADGASKYAKRWTDGSDGSTAEFAVAGIAGAKGFTSTDDEEPGAAIVFTRGVYLVQLVMSGTDGSEANATRLAKAQFDRLT